MLERRDPCKTKRRNRNKNVIPQLQLQTLRLIELIASGMHCKKTTAITYLDIYKTFDICIMLWHQGLTQIGLVIGPVIKIIHSFLGERQFKVRLETTYVRPEQSDKQATLKGP